MTDTETPERQAQIRALLHTAAAAERDERRTVAMEQAAAAFVMMAGAVAGLAVRLDALAIIGQRIAQEAERDAKHGKGK